MTRTSVFQAGIETLLATTPQVQVGQAGVQYLSKVQPSVQVSQVGIEYLFRIVPQFAVHQAGVEYLYKTFPCNNSLTQLWTLTRVDGTVLRFTSLDKDFEYRGNTYLTCGSLMPTASENVGGANLVGNMDLSGLLDIGAITFHDLHAGLYNGAHIEAWLVAWEGTPYHKILLRGTFGDVDYTEDTFTVEVMGDGGRLQQTPLIAPIERPCRWVFGDPVTCQKDLGPLTVTGSVTSTLGGYRQFTDSTRVEADGYFRRGFVTFTSGDNNGISAEIKEYIGGQFILWPKLAYPIQVGDTYSMTPGCTNQKEDSQGCNGCDSWANYARFGGFRSIPGRDKVSKPADVKKTV